ncbi:MAG: ISL3 family transposase [Chloroflexota bacterium]|nr:ISL3 family transposase [Chloroflexota bacterium]
MCTFPDLASVLLPNPADLDVLALELGPDHQLTVVVTSVQSEVGCPNCRAAASRIHSRYTRTLADLPWADFTVRLQLISRKWFCPTNACPRRIFTERLPTIVAPWARRTRRLIGHHHDLGLTLGGRAGTRLASRLDQPTSRDTLLRGVRRSPETPVSTPRHLGVDDFAFRKGQTYGTLLVDLDHGEPIDVLPDRSAETLTRWLHEHPGVELISRDRAGAYAEGATNGAPDAVQVADRWHILKNLGEALSRLFTAHPQRLKSVPAPPETPLGPAENACRTTGDTWPVSSPSPDPVPSAPPATRQTKRQQLHEQRQAHRAMRYEQVQALIHQGVSLRAIARRLQLSRGTVRTYARAARAPIPQPRGKRASLLEPYIPYLLERWNAGRHVGTELLREIEAQGYQGGRSIAMDFFAAIRKQQGVTPMRRVGLARHTAVNPVGKPPSSRELAWLVLQRPERLDEVEQAWVRQVRHADPKLELAVMLAQEFALMVRERHPDGLDTWLERIETSGLADLRSFAAGIRRDYAAVKAALTVAYSNGIVEGNINRLKYLKKQMYGRANFDLLRKRVLHAA